MSDWRKNTIFGHEVGGQLIDDGIISDCFCCDIAQCKGACCTEGDEGAPITMEEVEQYKQYLNEILPYVSEEGKKLLQDGKVYYLDEENEPVTQLLSNEDCVFVTRKDGGLHCAIELAYRDGKIPCNKPISCHLYPIRCQKYDETTTALRFDRWKICRAATVLGREQGIKVYQFLKEPLIRKFGQEWYDELCSYAEQYEKYCQQIDNQQKKK